MSEATAQVERRVKPKPKINVDPLEVLGDWWFVVLGFEEEMAWAGSVEQFRMNVLVVVDTKDFERRARGKKVIVLTPSEGPDVPRAAEAAKRCRAGKAATVIPWVLPGLGTVETPDLVSYCEKYNITTVLDFSRPWNLIVGDAGSESAAVAVTETEESAPEDDITDPVGTADPVAFHGVLGRLALNTQSETEANPLFVLLHLMAFFGTAVGRAPHFVISASIHYLNLFVGLVGPSGHGRKGTAEHVAKAIWGKVDALFVDENVTDGLNSGAGLLYHLRDASEKAGKDGCAIDEGVRDKNRVFLESELSSVLMQGHRENDPLLGHLRKFFDGQRTVRSNTKDPTKVTEGHVGAVGHCTPTDLEIHLSEADKANGTANRFLWMFGVRSKLLPRGGDVFELIDNFLDNDVQELRGTVEFAREVGKIYRSNDVEARWVELYADFNEIPPGRIGAFFVRAPVIVLRLAAIFALADRKRTIEMVHLDAALAIWEHSARSLRWIFGCDVDPRAEKLLAALKENKEGLTKRQIIHEVFKKNVDVDTIDALLRRLLAHQSVERVEDGKTGGRPAARYRRKRW